VATIVGAIGGGYVGNEIEKNRAGPLVWEVRVRYDDGGYASIHQSANPDVRPGDRVRVTATGIELLKR
jgi:outer membrane lipoprotein SlyB